MYQIMDFEGSARYFCHSTVIACSLPQLVPSIKSCCAASVRALVRNAYARRYLAEMIWVSLHKIAKFLKLRHDGRVV